MPVDVLVDVSKIRGGFLNLDSSKLILIVPSLYCLILSKFMKLLVIGLSGISFCKIH
ncbi:hypothetical protein LguiA_029895 [Lonicera macranthoides]